MQGKILLLLKEPVTHLQHFNVRFPAMPKKDPEGSIEFYDFWMMIYKYIFSHISFRVFGDQCCSSPNDLRSQVVNLMGPFCFRGTENTASRALLVLWV